MELVLLDNTVLTNYALVKRLDILLSIPGKSLLIPEAAADEYAEGVARSLVPAVDLSSFRIVKLNDEEEEFAGRLSNRFGSGERSCIAVCFFRGGIFASDDKDARSLCEGLKIPVTGTIGILVDAVRRAYLNPNDAQDLLEVMISLGYRSLHTDVSDRLRE